VRVSGLTGVADVDGDYYNSYAVRQDGTVWAWGANMSGALGNGVDCYDCTSNVPVQVVDLTGAVDVAGHGDGAHVLDTTGRVWAWGNNQDGDLGTHAPSYSTRPILIPGLQGVTKLGDGGRALAPTT
jgi:alpha-tubulin suppressor-like RCC1 family protein